MGVVAAHHHLLLAQQQIGEGILQLGVDQAHGAGGAAHHTPVGIGQAAAVNLLQQHHQPHPRTAAGPLQAGIGTQPPAEQFQHLRLLLQGAAAPEPVDQMGQRDILQLLFLAGGERLVAGAGREQGVAVGHQVAGGQGLGRQIDQTGQWHQLLQGDQAYGHRAQLAPLQITAQVEEGVGVPAEGAGVDRHEQQGAASPRQWRCSTRTSVATVSTSTWASSAR